MRKETFNFRDITKEIGVPENNPNHWAIGQRLVKLAARHGIEPERVLTEKTNPNPSVKAPHCIAAYPMFLFEEACDEIRKVWADSVRQLPLEFGESSDPFDRLAKIHRIAVQKWSEGKDDGWLKIMQLSDPGYGNGTT